MSAPKSTRIRFSNSFCGSVKYARIRRRKENRRIVAAQAGAVANRKAGAQDAALHPLASSYLGHDSGKRPYRAFQFPGTGERRLAMGSLGPDRRAVVYRFVGRRLGALSERRPDPLGLLHGSFPGLHLPQTHRKNE